MKVQISEVPNGFYYKLNLTKSSKIKVGCRVQRQKTFTERKKLTNKQLEQTKSDFRDFVLRELIEKESQGIAFGDLVDSWYDFAYREASLSKMTISDYYGYLKKHCSDFWKTPADEISFRDLKVLFSRLDKQYSKSFLQTLKTAINHVLKYGNDESLIKVDRLPTVGIKVRRADEKQTEILTKDQIKVFLHQAKLLEHPWYPVWLFALLTGCRNGEIYAVKWEDISLDDNMITICRSYNNKQRIFKTTKSGKIRKIPINKDLRELLLELKNVTSDSEFVLPRLAGWNKGRQAEILRTFLISLKLPSIRFHALRACFATMLLNQGVSNAQLMKVAGWSDWKTMQRYIRAAGIDEKGLTDNLSIAPDLSNGYLIKPNFGIKI